MNSKMNHAGNQPVDERPVIIVAEDNAGEAASLIGALSRACPGHRIHPQPDAKLLSADIVTLNPQVLILDRRMDEFSGSPKGYDMEVSDMQIWGEKFRRDFPHHNSTIVIIYSNYGEPDYARRFNARRNKDGIYYVRKPSGHNYLVSFIRDIVLLQWPEYPNWPP